ncbi:MAG: FG-GAP repeat domain-containing protein [Candidatus Binatia bacterium]
MAIAVTRGASASDLQFRSPVSSVAVGDGPHGVVAADLNGDGLPDIVTANAGSSNVSLLLGRGDGSFVRLEPISIRINELFVVDLRAVAVADLDGDGIPDLVLGCENSCASVFVLLGEGEGVFAMPQEFFAGRGPLSVAIADLNRDGFTDLVAALRFNDAVSVLLGHGDGTFGDREHFDVRAAGNLRDIAVTDLDGDGVLDIVAASGDLAVLLGVGDGSFVDAQLFPVGEGAEAAARRRLFPADGAQRFPGDEGAEAVAVGDLNGDAVPDVVTANHQPDGVSVLLGHGDGTFGAPETLPVGIEPTGLALADLNGDGFLDAVTANFASNDLSLLLGLGNGTFAPERRLPAGDGPRGVAIRDLNGDGRPDLVAANSASDDVSVLLAEGGPEAGSNGGCQLRERNSETPAFPLLVLFPVALLLSARRLINRGGYSPTSTTGC